MTYTVTPNDSIDSIAETFQVPVSESGELGMRSTLSNLHVKHPHYTYTAVMISPGASQMSR